MSDVPSTTATSVSANASSQNNNRRELPNVPRNTSNYDNKPSPTVSQNPFYNPSGNAGASSGNHPNPMSRSTPAQWMGNIGQTLRRQTSNLTDVSSAPGEHLRVGSRSLLAFQGGESGNKDESEDTLANLKKTFAGIFGDM